jgi:glutaredoxin
MTANPMQPIVMYSTLCCPDCRRAKSFLKDRGVDFVEVFIEGNAEPKGLVLRVNNGRRRVPTIQVGDRFSLCSPVQRSATRQRIERPSKPLS